jgi:selenocysteine lyase/cysteine desulfurase
VIRARAASRAAAERSNDELARDESFWRDIQLAFLVDRTILNLDNGAVAPAPRAVHDAARRYQAISNQAPVHYMWNVLEPHVESVRRGLAGEFGCDPEELAITRSGSEALQIAQLGITLARSDEVVTTTHDFPRMRQTWDQRARREGITVSTLGFEAPVTNPEELIGGIERLFTPRTRVLHVCHVTHFTGEILPVADLCRLARARGIQTIVDGAQAVGQTAVDLHGLGCDYYGASLHKWMAGPIGTGFLFVRRDRIPALWPLQPAPLSSRRDIRKLEEIGTHPAAAHNALAEALAFHQALGTGLKAARLAYLRARWTERLAADPRIRVLTNLDRPGALATFSIEGFAAAPVASQLWERARILVGTVEHPDFSAIRVTPHLYTTLADVDRFSDAMEEVIRRGPAG